MRNILLSTLPIMLLSACMSGPISNGVEQAKSYEEANPITLVKQEKSMELSLAGSSGDLNYSQKAQIQSFLYGYNDRGTSNITVSVPESGISAAPARTAVKQITQIIEDAGIKQDAIMIATYMPTNIESGSIKLEFTEIEAKAPKCDNNWSENMADAYNNTRWKGLGCSSRRNLAAMIVNPQDLEQMDNIGKGNSERRLEAMDKYVAGQSSSAARNDNETARSTQ